MDVDVYVVDAFTKHPFAGNPAGVCFPDASVGEDWRQAVAAELKHAETAFLFPQGDRYKLRWFTPTVEVDLCGHATLASAHVLWESERLPLGESACFMTKSGRLSAARVGESIQLDFPAVPAKCARIPKHLADTLGATPVWFGSNGMDMIAELESEQVVRDLRPDLAAIAKLRARGLIVTARGLQHDFVSRFFAPQSGVNEDPVTGSAHCCLGPYWAEALGKETLDGYQVSPRGGLVRVIIRGSRVLLCGHAVTVLRGHLCC